MVIGLSSNVLALTATTVGGFVACFTKEQVKDMTQFVIAKDKASFQAYIDAQLCVSLKGGLTVTVLKSPGMFGTKVQFAFQGLKMWTLREALTDYK